MDVKKIAVIGAGAMGNGIAQVALMAGYTVTMNDVEQRFIDRGVATIKDSLAKFVGKGKITEDQNRDMLGRLVTTTDLKGAVSDADLVIEAVFEDLDLKKRIFKDLDAYAKPDAVLASNTSSMSITAIASAASRPERVVGMHFFNPAVLLKLVEVIYANQSSDAAIQTTYDVAKKMNKVPVIVRKDSPGFIYNRVNAPTALLLQLILDKGSPTPAQFDAVFKPLMPMTPFELSDYVGLDIVQHTQQYYSETLSKDYTPRKALVDLVKSGNLGRKTGRGIYDWSAGRPVIDTSNPTTEYDFTHMVALQVNEATKCLEEGVTNDPKDIDLAIANGGGGMGPFTLAKSIGYPLLVQRCNELADKFGIEVFRPTKTMQEGKVEV
ncbi:MAG TPA: 3-hydroxyacyl-CoA dehydrogenase NAD-binding domain-containing protein [Deltaproteobacteria bacterium]|nr:3-hydroxyacyl-CoA dehydrogenase NAD-binding domain-containing protein [Deltaproteobacteria bacterium]HOI05497.1 3-hydroxyacyl-CoA dehydrogenase NAD-binding domain-containing protein [Deltaproteobacteria bacterium]